jgi:hypothetical protein
MSVLKVIELQKSSWEDAAQKLSLKHIQICKKYDQYMWKTKVLR